MKHLLIGLLLLILSVQFFQMLLGVGHTHTIVTSTSTADPPFPAVTDPETTVPYVFI